MQRKTKTKIVIWSMAALFVAATVALVLCETVLGFHMSFPLVIPFMVIPVVVILIIFTKMSKIKKIIVYSMIAIFVIALAVLFPMMRVFDTGGDDGTNWGLFLTLYAIPFMVVPVIVTAVLVIISGILALDRSFKHLANRLTNINQKLQNCSPDKREKLTKEKQSVEQELARFWACEYCKVKNHNTSLRCHACGANAK